MPSYEYVCKDCNHGFTAFLSIKHRFSQNAKRHNYFGLRFGKNQ